MKNTHALKQWQKPKLILFEADQVLTGSSPGYGPERIRYCNGTNTAIHNIVGTYVNFMGIVGDQYGDNSTGVTANAADGCS